MRVESPSDARDPATAEQAPPVEQPDGGARDNLRTFCYWMLGAVALGLAIRLGYAIGWKWDQPIAVLPDQIGGDAGYYHYQANALAEGLWFVDPWSWALRGTGVHPGAEHPPLYTLFLSIPSVLGFETFRQHMIASTILGSFTCGVVGFAGRAVAGRRVGIIAAFIAAVYANLWINDALVMSETITALVVAFVVWFAYRFWREPTVRNALIFGFLLGLATLTRAEMIFYVPIVALPLVIGARSLITKERVQRFVLIAVMAALPVLPWVVFNMVRFNNPVTLSTGGDFTFGNTYCDSTFYGERIGWWDLTCMDDRWQIEGDESDQSKHFRDQGLEYLGDNLDRFPVAVAARVGRMWDVYAPFQKLHWDSFEMGRNPFNFARLALAQFYVLAILAIVGLVMLRKRRTIIYPLIGLAISVTIAAVLTFGGTRYRIPAEIAIIIAASVPLAALWNRWFPSRDAATSGGELPGGSSDDSADGAGDTSDDATGSDREPEPAAT